MDSFDAVEARRRQEQQAAADRTMLSFLVHAQRSQAHQDQQEALWREHGRQRREKARADARNADLLINDVVPAPKTKSTALSGDLSFAAGAIALFMVIGACINVVQGIGNQMNAAATKMGLIAPGASLFSDKKVQSYTQVPAQKPRINPVERGQNVVPKLPSAAVQDKTSTCAFSAATKGAGEESIAIKGARRVTPASQCKPL